MERTYTQFWAVSLPVGGLPPDQWEPVLSTVTAEPELTTLLMGQHSLHDNGIKLYGQVTPRITSVNINGNDATVTDCQDASHSGQADASTGKPKNVGVVRNPVAATLVKGQDGQWRVSRIHYPGGEC